MAERTSLKLGPGKLRHLVGRVVFALGAIDIATIVWLRLAWEHVASPGLSYPLLAISPNPLATWLQSVFVGVVLAVRGARMYSGTGKIAWELVLTLLSVILVVLSMVLFTTRDYNASLGLFLLAIALFVV